VDTLVGLAASGFGAVGRAAVAGLVGGAGSVATDCAAAVEDLQRAEQGNKSYRSNLQTRAFFEVRRDSDIKRGCVGTLWSWQGPMVA